MVGLKPMYKEAVLPIVSHLDPETWHNRAREAVRLAEESEFTLKILELLCAAEHQRFENSRLATSIGGVPLENPVVLGAGWDKYGRSVRGVYRVGFSGIEIGGITLWDQDGNPIPREYIIGLGTLINSYGFRNPGADIAAKNLERYALDPTPVGINIGLNKEIDRAGAPLAHSIVVKKLYRHASWFTIDPFSPNTKSLVEIQNKGALGDIVTAMNETMDNLGGRKPIFLKISPDQTREEVFEMIDVVIDNKAAGIIASNTTKDPSIKAKYGPRWADIPGGFSGDDEDYRQMSSRQIDFIWRESSGSVEIVGAGGVKDSKTALDKILRGATSLQVVTAVLGEGPMVAGNINRGIIRTMDEIRVDNLTQLIGKAHGNLTTL